MPNIIEVLVVNRDTHIRVRLCNPFYAMHQGSDNLKREKISFHSIDNIQGFIPYNDFFLNGI
jgi:hypothetical protein